MSPYIIVEEQGHRSFDYVFYVSSLPLIQLEGFSQVINSIVGNTKGPLLLKTLSSMNDLIMHNVNFKFKLNYFTLIAKQA